MLQLVLNVRHEHCVSNLTALVYAIEFLDTTSDDAM